MKILIRIIFIYLLKITAISALADLSEQLDQYFKPKLFDLSDNNSSDEISNNTNLKRALKYLAPSYFALVITEILPNRNLKEFMDNSTCFKRFMSYINFNSTKDEQNKIKFLIKYSAKNFPDYGDEEGCLSKKYTSFILFALKYNLKLYNYTGKFNLLPFISSGYSFYGLCIENTKDCTDVLKGFIVDRINKYASFNQPLNGIDDYNINAFIHYPDEKNEEKQKFDKTSFIIIINITLFYVVIRLIIWFIGSRFFKEEEEITKKKNDDDSSSSEEEEEEEEDETNTKTKEKEKTAEKTNLIEKEEKKVENKKIYPRFYFIYQLCSVTNGLKIIFQKKGNLYYNESDLYFILIFRFLAIIFKALITNYDFFLHNPSKEINNTDLYDVFLLFVLKFSSFADIILIITESIILSYKLMSFLRKNTKKGEQPSFSLFLNFFFRIIPSLFTTMLIFIVFYLCSNSIIALLNMNNDQNLYLTKIQHLSVNLLNCHSCTNEWKTLIPFYMQYANYKENDGINENCFNFMIIMVNLFYCYFILILLTFVIFKIRTKLYDIIISIIFLVNFLLPHETSCYSFLDEHNYFNLKIILGEKCSTTFTHLFINYYFLGFIIGIALFYNNDLTNENSFQNSGIYNPFSYLKDFTGILFRFSTFIHILIIIITVAIPILLFLSFFLHANNNSSFIYLEELNGFDKFLYLNEKKVFAIFFGLFLLHLYLYKNESILKEFGNNIIVVSFNRVCFEFYALIEIIIYFMYSIFGLNYQITSYNVFFSSFGIIFFLYLLSSIFLVLFNLPIRMLTKKFLSKES